MNLVVRRLGADDWPLLRDVRLRALADSPTAFASTLEREEAFDDTVWRDRMHPRTGLKTIVLDGEEPVGLIGGYVAPDADDRSVEVVSMWVAPTARRRGVGSLLVADVLGWADAVGRPYVQLWVVADNDAARRLYQRHGFALTGQSQPLPSRPDALELQMVHAPG